MSTRAWVAFAAVVAGFVFGRGQGVILSHVVTVPFQSATPFSLGSGDAGPGSGYVWTVIETPAAGALLGAAPDLVYVPQSGFRGTDWMKFSVVTAEGQFAVGTVKFVVLGPVDAMGAPALLTEGELVFSGSALSVDGYRFVLELRQRFTHFEQSLRATWDATGFTALVGTTRVELEGTWPAAWRLPIVSTLSFDPTIPGLSSWTVDARTAVGGTTWAWKFYFSGTDPQTGSYTTFQVQGAIGQYRFDTLLKLLTLTPTFGEMSFLLAGPWFCDGCPTNWEAEFRFTKAGFERLGFLAKDIPIPCPGCGALKTLFDLRIRFTADSKKVEPTLRIVSAVTACVRQLVALDPLSSGFGLGGIDLYGIEIKCEVTGGYTLRLATAFNPLKNSEVTGDLRFFELWQLEGPVVPCCGNPGRFQVSAYFEQGSASLFGFGMGNLILYVPVSREVLVKVGLKVGKVDPTDPAKTWILTTGWQGLF